MNTSVSELPGGIPAPVPTVKVETVQVTPDAVADGTPLRKPPAFGFVAGGAQGAAEVAVHIVHPAGALIVKAVTVNWLLAGFPTVRVNVAVFPPKAGLFPVTDTVGRLALAATIGEATGMRIRRVEKAKSARIVPELNFVTYALEGVFILYFQGSGPFVLI